MTYTEHELINIKNNLKYWNLSKAQFCLINTLINQILDNNNEEIEDQLAISEIKIKNQEKEINRLTDKINKLEENKIDELRKMMIDELMKFF